MKRSLLTVSIASVLVLSGCATNTSTNGDAEKIAELQRELDQTRSALEDSQNQQSSQGGPVQLTDDLLPPNARPGECYARAWVDPTYRTLEKQVVAKEESEVVDIIPAKYEWVEEQVLVQEASTRLERIEAVYGTETDTIQVREAERFWRTDLGKTAPLASEDLLAAARRGGINLEAATPGMCFHEHYRPAKYDNISETVEVKAASFKLETKPAQYEWVEETVLVREASYKLVDIPAEYETVTEQVVDVPAHTTWKKGTGPIQKIDEATGEIMCLVEVPATYKTVSRRVLKSAARTERVEIPAEYKTVKVKKMVAEPTVERIDIPAEHSTVNVVKKVAEPAFLWHEIHDPTEPKKTRTGAKICLVETAAEHKTVSRRVVTSPADVKEIVIPAEYKTVKVKKLVSEAQEKRTKIPAEYKSVSYKEVAKEGFMEWRPILCETNTTDDLIARLQGALKERGYKPGSVDGVLGSDTISAVNQYQQDNNLPVDKYLNIETLKSLNVL